MSIDYTLDLRGGILSVSGNLYIGNITRYEKGRTASNHRRLPGSLPKRAGRSSQTRIYPRSRTRQKGTGTFLLYHRLMNKRIRREKLAALILFLCNLRV